MRRLKLLRSMTDVQMRFRVGIPAESVYIGGMSAIPRRYVVMMIGVLAGGLLASPCLGQTTNSVLFCAATLRVGMPKTEVLAAVSKQCAVKDNTANAAREWCVSGQYTCSHTVSFGADDKLRFVSKDLGSAESSSAADVLADFISAVEKLTGGAPGSVDALKFGPNSGLIVTETTLGKDPATKRDIVVKEVPIRTGQNGVVLQVNRPVGGGNASISVVGIAATEMLSNDSQK
jgi:hypothetical protein